MNDIIQPGTYRHFKGGLYEVFGCARHSETEEEMVVYRPLSGDRGWWVRPSAMFLEEVPVNGAMRPRFQRIESAAAEGASGGRSP